MPDFTFTITDAEFEAVDAGVPGKGAALDRVTDYLSGQLRAVVQQHVDREQAAQFARLGLPATLAAIGLDDDSKQVLVAHAEAKIAAVEAAKLEAAKLAAAKLAAPADAQPAQ